MLKRFPEKTTVKENPPDPPNGKEILKLTSDAALQITNSLSAHIAILDQNGTILATNRAWADFAEANSIQIRPDTVNVNYLKICDTAIGNPNEDVSQVSKGIRDLIEKKIDEFSIEYPCHSPHEKRWFYMRATRISDSKPLRIVISHENITDLKKAETDLRRKQAKLEYQKQELEESNLALKVVLKQRENDRQELQENLVSNVKELILPAVEKLQNANLSVQEKAYLNLIESQLNNITSPLIRKLSSKYMGFTPRKSGLRRL